MATETMNKATWLDSQIKYKIILLVSLAAFVAAGCATNNTKLFGTWISKPRETEWGHAGLIFEFRTNGVLSCGPYWPEHANRSFLGESTYLVRGNQIIISKGSVGKDTVKFWFNGADLMLKYDSDKAFRLKRR